MPFNRSLVLSQAFRPFFPLAALTTAISVLLWVAGLAGFIPLPPNASLWHAHEMLFGFASAVIIGFVMTAAVNWTGLNPLTPQRLAWLVGFLMVFMGGRVIPFFSGRRLSYSPRQYSALNWLSTLSALACAPVMLSNAPKLTALCASVAAVSTLLRWLLWQPWRSHAGRPIKANGWISSSFVLVVAAGGFRMLAFTPAPMGGQLSWLVSALLWAAAFGLFAIHYVPQLWLRPHGMRT